MALVWGPLSLAFPPDFQDLETFDDGNLDEYTDVFLEVLGNWVSVTVEAAHDGPYGLQYGGKIGNWIYRDDADVYVEQGDILSVWIRANGGYGGWGFFGFGATASGTLAMVMAPNTAELLLQVSTNRYNRFKTIGSAPQTWLTGQWYRMEVTWETSGFITGRLYDSDGATLLNTVTATNTAITSGGIGFRSFDGTKSFDTVQVIKGGALSPPVPGITVSPTSGLLTSESGDADSFTVVLDAAPTADVTIGISSSDTSEGTVSPTSLIFTPANWSTPQTVTVTGVDDLDVDGNIAYTIITAAAVSTDANYDGLNPDDVSVTNIDDEAVAGVTVTGILPDTITAGNTISVTITGSGFVTGASVTFRNGAGPAPKVSNIVVIGDGSITATVSAHKKAKASAWDVVITNTDGSTGACVGGCFTVTLSSSSSTSSGGGGSLFVLETVTSCVAASQTSLKFDPNENPSVGYSDDLNDQLKIRPHRPMTPNCPGQGVR